MNPQLQASVAHHALMDPVVSTFVWADVERRLIGILALRTAVSNRISLERAGQSENNQN